MQNRITQAVILSAGLGTRLKPYTDTMPKPMIPILGKPMLEWHIEQFKKHGVTEFFLNTHYLPDVIKNYFGDGSKWGVKVNYSFEPVILGTAGALKNFEPMLNDYFFLIYGDTFSLLDYSKMAETFFGKDDPIGMQLMKHMENYADADVAELDDSGKYVAIHAKPHTEKYSNAYRMRGAFIFRKKVLDYIPRGKEYQIGNQVLPDIVRRGEKFYSYECSDYSKGIDTLEKWKEVEEHLKKNNINPWWN